MNSLPQTLPCSSLTKAGNCLPHSEKPKTIMIGSAAYPIFGNFVQGEIHLVRYKKDGFYVKGTGNVNLFRKRCLESIQRAIAENKDGNVEMIWFFENYDPENVSKYSIIGPALENILKIYTELEDRYWNEYQTSLSFGGRERGSCVSIIRTDNKDELLKTVLENQDYYRSLNAIAQKRLGELKEMPLNLYGGEDIPSVNGIIHAKILRVVSDCLKPLGGTLISQNGVMKVMRI